MNSMSGASKWTQRRSVNYPALRFEANGRTVDATVVPHRWHPSIAVLARGTAGP